jgi:hypothetical protein
VFCTWSGVEKCTTPLEVFRDVLKFCIGCHRNVLTG